MPDSAPLMSLRAYAKRRGVSAMAVSNAIAAGRLVKSVGRDQWGQPKIADPDLADQEWDRNTDPQRRINAAGGVDTRKPLPAPVADDIATSTERLKAAQADLAELDLAKRSGELVSQKEITREWASLLSSVRTKLLGIPTAAKQLIPELTVKHIATIDGLIRSALEDLVEAEQ